MDLFLEQWHQKLSLINHLRDTDSGRHIHLDAMDGHGQHPDDDFDLWPPLPPPRRSPFPIIAVTCNNVSISLIDQSSPPSPLDLPLEQRERLTKGVSFLDVNVVHEIQVQFLRPSSSISSISARFKLNIVNCTLIGIILSLSQATQGLVHREII
ncbi:hypothetical protein Droror1_Dr00000948 [Drosera rotundifolia]